MDPANTLNHVNWGGVYLYTSAATWGLPGRAVLFRLEY